MTDNAVGAFLDYGILNNGFARVRCGACAAENLVAFSCPGRGLCPFCVATRAAQLAAWLRKNVLEDDGHAQWVLREHRVGTGRRFEQPPSSLPF